MIHSTGVKEMIGYAGMRASKVPFARRSVHAVPGGRSERKLLTQGYSSALYSMLHYVRLRQQLKLYHICVMLRLAYIARLGGFASLKAATRALQSCSNFKEGKSE